MSKPTVRALAVCGGTPAFPAPLHVGGPNVGDRRRLHERLDALLDRRWLTNRGPLVQELEHALTQYLGVRHCVAVCNATVGLEVAARALALRGEVIVPAYTFVAPAHALRWLGLEPIFCDVDPVTHTIDAKKAAALVTPRTSAVLGVHLWGRPCDVDALQALARDAHLRLLFDAAHAFASASNGTFVGHFGDLEVFSFHATKFVNAFEGGAVATNSDELAERLRLMINFGFAGYDRVVELGTNAKMSEMSAAMGLTSLEQVDAFLEVNARNYQAYARELQSLPALRLMTFDPGDRVNLQYIVVDVARGAALSRDELVEVLWAEGVRARRYFHPGCHRMEPYARDPRWRTAQLGVTEALCERVMTLPTGTSVSADAVTTICDLLRTALEHATEVRRALAARRRG